MAILFAEMDFIESIHYKRVNSRLYLYRLTKEVVLKSEARVIYVATDQRPYKEELENQLKEYKVSAF